MNTSSLSLPQERVIMAIVSIDDILFKIHAHPKAGENGLIYLGQAKAGGSAGVEPEAWFTESFKRLTAAKAEGGKHTKVGELTGGEDKVDMVLTSPWYVVFETDKGDLWVGRFFDKQEGNKGDGVKTWYLSDEMSPFLEANGEARLAPVEAVSSVIFSTMTDAGGAEAAEGAHGGSTGKVRPNWP